ncbi:MAG: hypothetical protein APF77_02515 [Clostridia bacterium BRH_c25]|nr:MAG: hypothetical protein APF77_02515 [Clostridia bacterium BRH_c25]
MYKIYFITLILLVTLAFTSSCAQSVENISGTGMASEGTAEKNSDVRNQWLDIYNSINDKKINDEEKIKEIVELYYKIQYEESITLEFIDTSFMVAKNAVMKDEEILRACHLQRLRNMGEHYLVLVL